MAPLKPNYAVLRAWGAAATVLLLAGACSSHGGSADAGACDGSACGDASHRDAGPDARHADASPDAGTNLEALDPTVATNLATSSAFLYTGPNAVQTGVKPGTIDVTQVSVVRGQVSIHSTAASATDGLAPIAGVTVTVLGHPEFGATKTQSDGWFSMAVNGGGLITVDLQGTGYLEVQRHVTTRWLEYAITNPVVLTAAEPGTAVKLSASSTSFQVVRGKTHGTAATITPSEDADGARTATILIPPGTTASIDGLNDTSTTMRATEYTTGSAGLQAMPADLPPTSAYTYAVDLSIDEANGQTVTFSQPVLFYLENFIGFPVGDGTNATVVPTGYYDPTTGFWVTSAGGQVVKVLTNAGGTVTLDVTGAGQDTADSAFTPPLAAGERAQIAALYQAGQSFWRIGVPHFTSWDYNWGMGPPAGAVAPNVNPARGSSPGDGPCVNGAGVECENQILTQQLPVAGTPLTLNYQSDRTAGAVAPVSVQIPITGSTPLPSIVTGIQVVVQTQGRQWHFQSSSLAANQSVPWTWDWKDAYGRVVSGHSDVDVKIGYDYQASSSYQGTGEYGAWGGAPITGNRALRTLTLWHYPSFAVDHLDASTTFGLGGLSLTAQNLYDPSGQTFYGGDGTRRTVNGGHFTTITTYAGGGSVATGPISTSVPATSVDIAVLHMAMAADGTIYAATEGSELIAIDAKTRTMKTLATLRAYGVAVGSDGSVYVTQGTGTAVSRIDPQTGVVTTITSGTGAAGSGGAGIAVGPDGHVYFAVVNGGGLAPGSVEKIEADGSLTTVVANLADPEGVAFGPDGSLYVTEGGNHDVLRLSPSGTSSVVAGQPGMAGTEGDSNGDGNPATSAQLCSPTGIAVADDGSFYIADESCGVVRFVDTSGVITSVTSPAGSAGMQVTGDNGPAGAAALGQPYDVALAPGGGPGRALYVGDAGHGRIRLIAPPLPGFNLQDAFIPSADGSVVYEFDDTGKHQHTYDALRGQTLQTLSYDSNGFLASVTDNAGNVASVDRSQAGKVVISAPFGQKTTIALDAAGYAQSVANPNGETVGLTYETTSGTENGLLATLTDPKGQVHSFQYSPDGLLTQDNDPAGGQLGLVRSNATATGWTVTHTTRMGYVSTYTISTPAAGGWERDITDPTGATSSYVEGTDGSLTTTVNDSTGHPVETSVVQLGPDPRYAMLSPLAASGTATLQPSGLAMTMAHTRTASVGSNFFALQSQVDVVTLNPSSAQPETLTTTYTAGSPNNTLLLTTTTGRSVSATLDMNDRVVGITIPGIAPQTITYNTAACPAGGEGCGGRVTSVTATSPTDGTRTWTSHYQYSPDTGFASSAVDAIGQTVSWTRDPVGRPLQTQLPDLTDTTAAQNQVGSTWDKNGNLSTLAVPSTASTPPTHSFPLYSPIDELETYAPPALSPPLATSNTSYTYNYDGQLTLIQVPNGASTQTVTPGYDSVGRLHTVVDSLSGVTSTIAYAPGGLPQSVTTSDGEVVSYAYGVDGPLLMSKAWSGSVSGLVTFTHDAFFRVASRAVNAGTPVTYNFDADGLYAGASGLVSYSVTRDFNGKNGLLTGSTLGSVTDALTYNGFGEPKTYAATFGGSPIYSSAITSRDANGRITGATETLADTTHTWAFGYDAHGDLDSATEDGTATAYVFDPNGNRLSAGGQASTYDAQDRLLTSPGATYTYANNGDLLTKVTSAGTASYAYDLRGALRSVSLPTGDTVAYVIDGQSRRVGRTWTHGAQKVTQGFLYDDQLHVAAELDGTGNVVSTFVYGTRFNVPDAMVRGGKTYRILSDWRGSVRAVVDANDGTVVETIDYDAWGNATVNDTTCAAGAACAPFQPFGFAGGLSDRETGLVRLGARDYDPSVGRWTQKDGAGFAGGRNFYVYAWNDPVDFIDFTGRFPVPQWAMDAAEAILNYAAGSGFMTPIDQAAADAQGISPSSEAYQAGSFFGTSVVAVVLPEEELALAALEMTETVASHANDVVMRGMCKGQLARPYVNFRLVAQEIMQAAEGVPDPQGVPGAFRWDVPGTFGKNEGTWELVYNTVTDTILHFNFTGPK